MKDMMIPGYECIWWPLRCVPLPLLPCLFWTPSAFHLQVAPPMTFAHLRHLPTRRPGAFGIAAKFSSGSVPHFGLWLNGKWVEAEKGQIGEVVNPATGQREATFASGDVGDIDEAVKSADEVFRSGEWSQLNPRARGRVLNRAAELLRNALPEFVESWCKFVREEFALNLVAFRIGMSWSQPVTGFKTTCVWQPIGLRTLRRDKQADVFVSTRHNLAVCQNGLNIMPPMQLPKDLRVVFHLSLRQIMWIWFGECLVPIPKNNSPILLIPRSLWCQVDMEDYPIVVHNHRAQGWMWGAKVGLQSHFKITGFNWKGCLAPRTLMIFLHFSRILWRGEDPGDPIN